WSGIAEVAVPISWRWAKWNARVCNRVEIGAKSEVREVGFTKGIATGRNARNAFSELENRRPKGLGGSKPSIAYDRAAQISVRLAARVTEVDRDRGLLHRDGGRLRGRARLDDVGIGRDTIAASARRQPHAAPSHLSATAGTTAAGAAAERKTRP